jgi:recombinational DNA repair protein RecT
MSRIMRALTEEQIDERIRKYHDVACGWRMTAEALQARVTALEAALAAQKARVVELEDALRSIEQEAQFARIPPMTGRVGSQ